MLKQIAYLKFCKLSKLDILGSSMWGCKSWEVTENFPIQVTLSIFSQRLEHQWLIEVFSSRNTSPMSSVHNNSSKQCYFCNFLPEIILGCVSVDFRSHHLPYQIIHLVCQEGN